jgi:hypothetical protein
MLRIDLLVDFGIAPLLSNCLVAGNSGYVPKTTLPGFQRKGTTPFDASQSKKQ